MLRQDKHAYVACLHSMDIVADYATISSASSLRDVPVNQRLWAALERQTANNPHRRMLHSAAKIRIDMAQGQDVGSLKAWWAYMVICLQRIFHSFTPEGSRLLKPTGFAAFAI
jgi:hypothetical protein